MASTRTAGRARGPQARPADGGAPGGKGGGKPGGKPGGDTGGAPARRAGWGLTLAALGVVFGDIGTSPLYALQTVFSIDHGAVQPTRADVLGVLSLIFYSLVVIVTVKYVLVIMRADNDGEGGVMALSALVRGAVSGGRAATGAVLLGILGASLFYGDSLITPAISVLSAVEGIDVATPGLSSFVVPIAVTILVVLFVGQRFGTARVGALFGPVMLVWFLMLAATGVREVFTDLGVLAALSPTYGLSFVVGHPGTAFVAMGAIVLCITGAEALYADMGHFGRPPIRRAWFAIVFPALILNYLGQGALLLRTPDAVSNPFFLLVPSALRVPLVVLATAATVIASQAVISGAFSVTRQAISLGLLPPMRVRQTSEEARGQVFLPAVNWLLFIGVLGLVLAFGSAERLATAYGVSVTGALLIDTLLLLAAAHRLWHWSPARLVLAGLAFGGLEAVFLAANLTKVAHGGWLPLLIAVLVFTVMTTWRRGRDIVVRERTEDEGPLQHFVDELNSDPLPRVPGVAVFLHPTRETTPLALRANVRHNHVRHESVLIVSVQSADVPHVPPAERVSIDDLGYTDDGIVHVLLRFGFSDTPDVPAALARACADDVLPRSWDVESASYFVSDATLRVGRQRGMRRWRKALFVTMAHNATDPAETFRLPIESTLAIGTQIEV